MLRVLQERKFPVARIRLLASKRSAGRRVAFNGATRRVEELDKRAFDGMDLALFSAGAGRSLEFAPEAAKRGAVVVDNSSAFRMTSDVPLIVPEVNSHALRRHKGIIANPNCSTIIMLVALKPLHDAAKIRRLIVATYQSVSGAGARAMWQLLTETKEVLKGLKAQGARFKVESFEKSRVSSLESRVLPQQIAFNVIPQVDVFLENHYTKEEMKMVNETRKILEEPALPVSATCARVPVFIAHSEAIWIETQRPLSPDQARERLANAPGVRLVDDPARQQYPLPIDAAARDEVLVGRIRRDETVEHGLALWVSGDNLRKGAATNAVQIAELLIKQGY
jgi:aspartate-semialdehyde dehydrogenase